jgi:hypothetical protein
VVLHDARPLLARAAALELADAQAYVPGGMFLGWVIENQLHDPRGVDGELERRFLARELTGPALFRQLGGVLDDRLLGAHARDFACEYLGAGEDQYLRDFEDWFPVPTMLHVHDTWDDYEWIRIRLVARYSEWRAARAG